MIDESRVEGEKESREKIKIVHRDRLILASPFFFFKNRSLIIFVRGNKKLEQKRFFSEEKNCTHATNDDFVMSLHLFTTARLTHISRNVL
jgi:hypothetical protein